MTPPSTWVAALKSYGDFVIAVSAVARVKVPDASDAPAIVAGRHLLDLWRAMDAVGHVEFIGDATWRDVPAAFDIGKRGKLAALSSLLDLRRRLSALPGNRLVFDRLGWRERFIGGDRQLLALPEADNIYTAYERMLLDSRCSLRASTPPARGRPVHAVIVPGSRLAHKVVPPAVIGHISAALSAAGVANMIVLLEGEKLAVPQGLQTRVLPRRFDALLSALEAADCLVSADSLSAHLGEYFGRPTFVATPVQNTYWLPRRAYETRAWARFDEMSPFDAWLESFEAASPAPLSTSDRSSPDS